MKNKNVDNKVAVSPSVPLIGSAARGEETRSGTSEQCTICGCSTHVGRECFSPLRMYLSTDGVTGIERCGCFVAQPEKQKKSKKRKQPLAPEDMWMLDPDI